MRMYEAMRLGAMLWPQAFLTANENGGKCARLSALHAIGKEWEDGFDVENTLAGPVVGCPSCNHITQIGSVAEIIVHLNDEHRWTREQIAEWLEPIEEAFYAAREKEKEHALVER